MKDKLKKWSISALIYFVVIVLSVVATNVYHEQSTKKYIQSFNEAGGEQVLRDISDTYKFIMENYSNYKLGVDRKKKIINELDKLREQLEEVDTTINKSKSIQHKIDFSFVYHDMKLVRLSLSDTTKDDIVPVIVLHANEGLKDLEKEITYIEFR